MDELYDHLDNYNEETTITELQAENQELKSKLEVYSESMVKLQKDFDKLASGYKQLEVNYSSLLKTAKAEIERKTQIITNLNLEKDRMVLKSYQNKNIINSYKLGHHDDPTVPGNYKKGKFEDEQQSGDKKSSPLSATVRTDKHEPRDKLASHQPDLRIKLLSLAHGCQQHDSNSKENIIQSKKDSDALKPRASIRDRRKSMPAICMDTKQQLSDHDVDLASDTYSKNLQQTNTEQYFYERPRSRMSETSSLEEEKSGYHEPLPDSTKQRSSRYDRYRDDKYRDKFRVRYKSSHRYKRSSERHHSGSREYFDPYYKPEFDRYRGKGRISGSPPRDKFYQRPSRELYRSKYDKSYPYEHERSLPRSQERYPMKRHLEQGYNEYEHKKFKMESYSRQHEEDRIMELDNKRHKMESHSRHYDEDKRLKDENKLVHKKYIRDPLEIQFSSCESPDYDYANVPNVQVKEIKLTATTKLDDPRIFSKKYVVSNNDGHVNITTAVGRNIDLVPLKNFWGITPVSMPEALLKRPPEPKQPAKDMCKKMEKPTNICIDSGDILNINIKNHHQTINEVKVPTSERKELPVLKPKLDEPNDLENSLKNILRYKIPKTRKSEDDKQNSEHSKEITLPVKPDDNNSIKSDISKISDMSIKNLKHQVHLVEQKKELQTQKQDDFVINSNSQLSASDTSDIHKYSLTKAINENISLQNDLNKNSDLSLENFDVNKHRIDLAEEKKEPQGKNQTANDFVIQSKSQLSSPDTYNISKYSTIKGVVENDLQMSDDNCDDHEQSDHVTNIPFLNTDIENKTLDKDKMFNTITEKQSEHATDKATSEPFKNKTSKKSKKKKKSKHKEPKDTNKSEDSGKEFGKPTKKKDKRKGTGIKHIKTKFSELFDDSTSLISPEDLGLSSLPAPLISDKCVPFFEDALDTDDLNSMKSEPKKGSIHLEKTNIQNKPHNVTVTEIDPVGHVNQDDSFDKSDRSNGIQTELTDDVIETIYQNLEPGVSEEENVVKTVIISTGVQPPVLTQVEKQSPPSKPEPQQKSIQDLSLKALATSTPQKIWQPDNVVAESKIPDSGCSSNNSQTVSVESSTVTLDKSDSTIVDSQINDCNVPDVRIFVKRRRKVIKK